MDNQTNITDDQSDQASGPHAEKGNGSAPEDQAAAVPQTQADLSAFIIPQTEEDKAGLAAVTKLVDPKATNAFANEFDNMQSHERLSLLETLTSFIERLRKIQVKREEEGKKTMFIQLLMTLITLLMTREITADKTESIAGNDPELMVLELRGGEVFKNPAKYGVLDLDEYCTDMIEEGHGNALLEQIEDIPAIYHNGIVQKCLKKSGSRRSGRGGILQVIEAMPKCKELEEAVAITLCKTGLTLATQALLDNLQSFSVADTEKVVFLLLKNKKIGTNEVIKKILELSDEGLKKALIVKILAQRDDLAKKMWKHFDVETLQAINALVPDLKAQIAESKTTKQPTITDKLAVALTSSISAMHKKIDSKPVEKEHKTRDATRATPEQEPEKRVSFAEAVQLLDGKLDLEAARTDAVKSHGRWGLVDAIVKAGAIKDAAQYGALYDNATISESDLKMVRESLERGEKVLPIFDPGEMTPDKLFAILFLEGGVPHYTESYGFQNLAKLRRIDPKDIPNLQNLAGESYDEQLAAFKAAYKKADPLEPTGARVLFTSDKREVTRTGTSATQDMQAFAKGEISFIDPVADMIRYRTQMDAGLRKIAGGSDNLDKMDNAAYRKFLDKAFADKTIDEYMPDREKITRYPNYAFENGGVPSLGFYPHGRGVRVDFYSPGGATVRLGSRRALG